jgi:cytosine/adenosine deaminase-related metal-dependent hydrolase
MDIRLTTPYIKDLFLKILSYGGLHNAHLHIDRSGTYDRTLRYTQEESNLTLAQKHSLIPFIHQSEEYDPTNLKNRVKDYLEIMSHLGTRRADSVIDTTADRVGLSALESMLELKTELKDKIEFRIGAYSPLGFRNDDPQRWELLKRGTLIADFIGLLPERDDQKDYPDHIGYKECCQRGLTLAIETQKSIHIHVDQKNLADENGTEQLLEVIEELQIPREIKDEPFIWLIHVISPSAYDESRFTELMERLKYWNIGIICCPSAALSMKQDRKKLGPMRNSIARIPEMLAAGIKVRLGSDNICDITSPAGPPDLLTEVLILSNAIRFYDLQILAKLGAGVDLNIQEIQKLKDHLHWLGQ